MKNLIFLLLFSIVSSVAMKAQTEDQFTTEDIRNAFDLYYNELKAFSASLENVPANIKPKNLNDFKEYLEDDSSTRITKLNKAYENLITYCTNYEKHHGKGSFQSYLNSESNEATKLPCFESWYSKEISLTSSSISCCSVADTCPECLTSGVSASVSNMLDYNLCRERYHNP